MSTVFFKEGGVCAPQIFEKIYLVYVYLLLLYTVVSYTLYDDDEKSPRATLEGSACSVYPSVTRYRT